MLRVALALACVWSLWAKPARAEDVPRPSIVRSVKLTLPFFGYTVIDDERTQSTSIGVSTGLLFARTWLTEVGVMGSSGEGSMVSVFVRLGVTPTLIDAADIEGGWTLNAGPWFGYRYDSHTDDDDGYSKRKELVHSVTEGVGVDLVRWWPSEAGLSLSFNVGLVLPFSRSEDATWSDRVPDSGDFHHALDIRGAVGVAF